MVLKSYTIFVNMPYDDHNADESRVKLLLYNSLLIYNINDLLQFLLG